LREYYNGSDSAASSTTLLVEWDGDADAAADLIERLIAAGVRLAAFGPMVNDLEELFLQLTAA
jgi:hypothetical protein